jgi:hypothetical protein
MIDPEARLGARGLVPMPSPRSDTPAGTKSVWDVAYSPAGKQTTFPRTLAALMAPWSADVSSLTPSPMAPKSKTEMSQDVPFFIANKSPE